VPEATLHAELLESMPDLSEGICYVPAVEHSNFYDYHVPRMKDVPPMHIEVIQTDNHPSGAGALSKLPGEACLLHLGSHRFGCHVGRGSYRHGVTSQPVNVTLTLSPETTRPPATQ
jgi:hypothetical protein